jgi:ABC-type uncharacterized transport system substrate-binding protein
VVVLSAVAGGSGFADEEEKRRVDISLSIFPRIVAVDNNFREKLVLDNKVQLLFLYSNNEKRAEDLAVRIAKKARNIGGMNVMASAKNINSILGADQKIKPTAIFISERLSKDDLDKVMDYAASENRLVFSPFSGDVERGAMVGISVTNRVKPYFNLAALKRSNIVINALLMKMSKRYE